jgi:hypothetical protein
MEKVAYDLAELFENTPVFIDEFIRFGDCYFDPETSPATVAKLMRGHVDQEYIDLAERLHAEIKDRDPVNYWQ